MTPAGAAQNAAPARALGANASYVLRCICASTSGASSPALSSASVFGSSFALRGRVG